MAEIPYMPLWVGDFLAKTLDLDAKETGAYMILLMAMWTGNGKLPNDQKKLQRVARVGRDWPKIWAAIECYFEVDEHFVTNKRLSLELHKVATKRQVNAQSGARGGLAKSLKNKEQDLANASNSLKQSYSYPDKEDISDEISKKNALEKDETERAVEAYNEIASRVGWQKKRTRLLPDQKSKLKVRIREAGGVSNWIAEIERAGRSAFLRGEVTDFKATFNFFLQAKSFAKLMDGDYDDNTHNTSKQRFGGHSGLIEGLAQNASRYATEGADFE